MKDVVYVEEGKETPFIEAAIALGYSELVLVYRRSIKKCPVHEGIILRSALVDKKGNDEYIALGTSLSVIPKGVTYLLDNEFDEEKDFVHQRRSGLNHIQLKECKKKGIVVLFNLSKLRKQAPKRVSTIIGRMKQNVLLAKKYGVECALVSMASDVGEMRHAKDVDALKRVIS